MKALTKNTTIQACASCGSTEIHAITLDEEFWRWVISFPAGDDFAGDFITDTKDLLDAGIDPATRTNGMCDVAEKVYGAFVQAWTLIQVAADTEG